ncbi:hypothetical protein CK203_064615 [Vitis vinifera]|uniref:Integrase catalytic domain-containing protein n=1 Tax=Vitis vinifera TaxID=29760 RepID=A0A438G2Z1_VITVI|nr:hypothetical protein CK203_064615 [Vitis vinifera]
MTSLLHFEEKVHQKKLQRADGIPLLFPRLLCQILEHLGYPEEPRLERRRHCREDFSLDKWHHLVAYFAPQGAPAVPAPPELPRDEQIPQAQQDEILTETTPPAPAAHPSVHMPEAIHPTSLSLRRLRAFIADTEHCSGFYYPPDGHYSAHQDQIIATQAQHTTILHQIQQHLSMQTPFGHDRSAPSEPLVPDEESLPAEQPIPEEEIRAEPSHDPSYLIFLCTPYLLYTQTLSHSGESQESNDSNHVRFGAEMRKIWPSEDNCIKLRDNFARWKSRPGWALNQSGFCIGILLISPQGDHIPKSVRLTFSDHHRLTNNIIEYEACIIGLETALDLRVRQLEIHGDSNLVIQFDELRYIHLPRVENQFADALATLASMLEIPAGVTMRPLLIGLRSLPSPPVGHEYILVAIDYFTKWVEAASYARLTVARVAKFIRSHIICRYGVPYELISDRGMHFREYQEDFEKDGRDFPRLVKEAPFALWAYRTSFRTSTGATPYSLVYGMEAVLPVEIEMGSLRVYQRKMAGVFRRRVMPRFHKGDLVLRALKGLISHPRGKFRPTWSGSYVIRDLTREGAAWLTDLDGKSVYGACQCGSAEEVLCVRSWSKDGWPSFQVAIFPTTHPYIDISYC